MKIAANIQPALHGGRSGIGYYTHSLLGRLTKECPGDTFSLQFFDPGGRKAEAAAGYEADNVALRPCRLMSASLYHLMWAFVPLPYTLFFKGKPDVSLFFNYYLPPGVPGKRLLVVYDTVIKDCPETMSRKTRLMLTLTLSRSLERADRIITISRFSKERIMANYNVPEDKISVVPCGVDRDRFYPVKDKAVIDGVRDKYKIPGEYYLYLGNLEPRKNISRLIEAYAKAAKVRDSLPVLVLAGLPGWGYEDIYKKTKTLGLEGRVVFTGYVHEDHVPLLINGAAAFCFPSLYEGFGMPPLEAMACGVPVIASGTSSLPEVVGDCGITVDPYDTDAMAQALIDVTDPVTHDRLSQMGTERAKLFSWEESAGKLRRIIEELANG